MNQSTPTDTSDDLAERDVLRAVYDAPDDDAPRLAYAAWLRARGDLRGEFIELQCREAEAPLNPGEQKRAAELEASCRRELLGPIERAVDEVTFRRGFVASCRLKKGGEDALLAWHSHRLWSTVEEIDCERVAPAVQAKALPSIARYARSLTGVAVEGFLAICAGPPAPRLSTLGCFLGDRKRGFSGETVYRSTFNAMADGRALPALRRLRVGTRLLASHYSWLWPSEAGRRLELLSVSNINGLLGSVVDGALALREWLDATGSGVPIPVIELREDERGGLDPAGWRVLLTLDERGERTVMHARYHKYVSRGTHPLERLAGGLAQLAPDALTSLTIEPTRALPRSDEHRRSLDREVLRQTRLHHVSVL